MPDALIVAVSLVAALVLALPTWRRWRAPWIEVVHIHPHGRRIMVAATEYRGCRVAPVVYTGSVTTWRDIAGHEIRDRARVEQLYAIWCQWRGQ